MSSLLETYRLVLSILILLVFDFQLREQPIWPLSLVLGLALGESISRRYEDLASPKAITRGLYEHILSNRNNNFHGRGDRRAAGAHVWCINSELILLSKAAEAFRDVNIDSCSVCG